MTEKNDEISVKEIITKLSVFISFLRTKWLNFLLTSVICAILGILFSYLQTTKYQAECTFILDEKSGGGGGLASLASSIGVDIGSVTGGSTSIFAYDNLLDILQSRRIVETVLLTEVDTALTTHQTLADLYLDFSKMKKGFENNPRLAGIHFNGYNKREDFTIIQDSILFVIYKKIIKENLVTDRTNKKTQIFKVEINSKNERFSKLMAERMISEAKNLYINIKTGTSQKNIDRLQQKADSLLVLLNGKSYETAETQVFNPNLAVKSIAIPSKLATRNEVILNSLYAEVVKNLEVTKTTLMLQTPVIQILDTPRYPLEKFKNGKLFYIVIFGFFGISALCFYYTYKFFMK